MLVNYLSKPGLGFENFFPQYADGEKHRRDLPAMLAVGASQKRRTNGQCSMEQTIILTNRQKSGKMLYTNILPPNKKKTGMEYEIMVGKFILVQIYWLNNKWAVTWRN